MPESQMPRSETPVLRDLPVNTRKYIKPSLINYPVYQYQTGTTFYLSKKQRIVVDAYLETGNEREATRVLNKLLEDHGSTVQHSYGAIHKWLQKPHVARYIAEKYVDRGKVNWLDKPKWEAWGIDVMQGKVEATTVQTVVWKEFGKAKGWYAEGGSPTMQFNTQINFTQSDGRA